MGSISTSHSTNGWAATWPRSCEPCLSDSAGDSVLMRWSIVRVIWLRELRDQLRDRRTVFMIVLLPVLIYPVGGLAIMPLAGLLAQPHRIGVCGVENLSAGT